MKAVGVKVRGTVVLVVMVVVTKLLLLVTSAIHVRITGHGSEITGLTYHIGLKFRLQLRYYLSVGILSLPRCHINMKLVSIR